jgi:hypothetical protein
MPSLVGLSSPIDDAKCYEPARRHRRPDGVRRPRRGSASVARHGRDDTRRHRRRHRRAGCGARFDDLTGTVLAGRHRPLRVRVPCLYLTGLNLSDRQIAGAPDLGRADARLMTGQPRAGLVARRPPVRLAGEAATGEADGAAGRGQPGCCRRKGRGAPGRGTLAEEEPPIPGPRRRGGEVAARMPAKVRQTTIRPVIGATVAKGALARTGEDEVHARPEGWGHGHEAVRHGRGEHARDDDGDGFREVHVETTEGFRSPPRPWPRPRRGLSRGRPPACLGFFRLIHHVRRRGEAPLGTLIAGSVAPAVPHHPETR